MTAERRYVVLTPVRNERPHLEATLAFQDRMLQELNQVVIRQQARLERIEAELRRLTERFDPVLPDASPDERPPHY